MKATVEVNEANFETEVLQSEQPVLVGFATSWALPCMTAEEALEEIATESASLKVACVKLDHNPNLGLWYGVRRIPTILCFVNGEERIGIFGVATKKAILSQLEPIVQAANGFKATRPVELWKGRSSQRAESIFNA